MLFLVCMLLYMLLLVLLLSFNDWKMIRKCFIQTIKVVDVSSSASTTALEFIYTGKCSFTYDNFFDLLLLANMFELRDMEEALVQHLSDMRYVKGDFVDLNDNSTTRENLEHGIVDFFVDGESLYGGICE